MLFLSLYVLNDWDPQIRNGERKLRPEEIIGKLRGAEVVLALLWQIVIFGIPSARVR
jgi:hypothetical protein